MINNLLNSVLFRSYKSKLSKYNIYFKKILVSSRNRIIAKKLKKQAKIKKGETDEKIREEIIAQLNAYVAKIYGVNGKELQYILDAFRLVPDSLKEKIIEEFNKL